jgi:type IV pilus assembly protein PilB
MILVTGPTGSGKSTTLYAALNRLNRDDVNISTAEDPVEYDMYGVNQVHCKNEIGLDFAKALRTFLRQDPDIIMVGEIRDQETAEISIKAALTGHLVLSTLHTNDAPSAIQRLMNMGIEPFMISASILMVQAQRLVRRICPYCKEKHHYSKDVFLALGLDYEKYGDVEFFKGGGCDHCNGSGYKRRTVIYEILHVNDELRDLIAKNGSTHALKSKARELGMITLRENGIQKAIDGITSLDEILRVTME